MDIDNTRFLPNLVYVLLAKSWPENSDVISKFEIFPNLEQFDLWVESWTGKEMMLQELFVPFVT